MRYGKMLREVSSLFDETHVYYFDISFEETLRRHTTKPNSHEFGEELMRELYAEKDILGLAGEKLFTDKQSEDEIFRSIMRDLQKKTRH